MPEPEVVAAAIARNARALRAERGWSLEHLAGRAGVSKGMLVQIEQARTNPSMGTLCRLADAYGVTLAQLVELSDTTSVRVVSADEVIRLWHGEAGSAGDLLIGVDRREHVELWRWSLAAGDSHTSEGHMDGTREMMTVLAGTLTLDVGEHSVTVETGGSVLFDGNVDHAYRNTTAESLDMILVVIQPSGGDLGAPSHPG